MKLLLPAADSKILIELDHIFGHLDDSFTKSFWSKHLDLVTIAEYPPAYLTKAVNAKLHNG